MSLKKILASEGITAAPTYTYTPNEPYVAEINPSKIPRRDAGNFQERLVADLKRKFPKREIRLDFPGSITGSPFTYIKFNGLGTGLELGMWFFQKTQDVWVLKLVMKMGGSHDSKVESVDIPWKGDLEAIYPKVLRALVALSKKGLEFVAEWRATQGW